MRADVVNAISARTDAIVAALLALDEPGLVAPSTLPGWSRLTIACHLRYGASALTAMTAGALAGEAVSYYPGGRGTQRPGTLAPEPGEAARDVVLSLDEHSRALHGAWVGVDDELVVHEPTDNPDLGSVPLGALAIARLTEVEVHGADLALGLPDWSDLFVELALPARLDRLNTRRSNHRAVDSSVQGTWLLTTPDGFAHRITVAGDVLRSAPARSAEHADATIHGARRDLLALLLGRPTIEPLEITGDVAFGRAFRRAIPGP